PAADRGHVSRGDQWLLVSDRAPIRQRPPGRRISGDARSPAVAESDRLDARADRHRRDRCVRRRKLAALNGPWVAATRSAPRLVAAPGLTAQPAVLKRVGW